MTFISILLRVLLFLIFVLAVFIYLFQSKLLFYPTKLAQDFVFKFALPHEEKFISYDNEKVHGLLFKAEKPKARILYFHGNGGALDSWGEVGVELSQKFSSDVLVMDYPGYGKSTGGLPKSEKELYQSAEAAFAEFVAVTDKSLPIIIYGRSLGSAVASYLAAKNTVQALILETPYTSMKEMAEQVFPLVPSFLVRYDLDNTKNIKELNIPILIIHGTQDAVVPFSQGQQLATQNSKAIFVTVQGGQHNDLSEYPTYWSSVEKFVQSL